MEDKFSIKKIREQNTQKIRYKICQLIINEIS